MRLPAFSCAPVRAARAVAGSLSLGGAADGVRVGVKMPFLASSYASARQSERSSCLAATCCAWSSARGAPSHFGGSALDTPAALV